MKQFSFTDDSRYSLYSVVGFVYAIIYLTLTVLVIFAPREQLTLTGRDYLSGVFLSAVLFGAPVTMLVGAMGIIYSRIEHKQGKFFGYLALIAPIIFLLALLYFWYPPGGSFWRYNFGSARAALTGALRR